MRDNAHIRLWATAISKNDTNDRQIIFRFVKEFSLWFDRASQPDRIIIVWRYESASGQPVTEEHRQMNFMEDSVQATLEQDNFATLALVSTGENLREWVYYARSEDEFLDRFDLALVGLPVFPIEIHAATDPGWRTYEEFLAGLKATIN